MSASTEAAAFLAAVEPLARRAEAERLDRLFREATGWAPALWPAGIVGYGRYRYRYDSGREGESLAAGFAPRRAEIVIHLPGLADWPEAVLARLGPHRLGKGCLYLRRLDGVDPGALAELVRAGVEALRARWPVDP